MTRVAMLVLASGLAVPAVRAQDTFWNNAAGGPWTTAANWTPANVPDSIGERAILSLAGPYTATLNATVTIGGLEVTGLDAVLHVANAQALVLRGAALNDRLIVVNPSAGPNGTIFQFEVDSTLSGTGILRLNANPGNVVTAILRSAGAGARVRQGVGHTVRGAGQISGVFTNEGRVEADMAARVLELEATTANSGVLGAINGATLRTTGVTITQAGAGTLLADGPGSVVSTLSTTIVGGSVRGQNGGVISVDSASVFTSTRNEGAVRVLNAQFMSVRGTGLVNDGTVTVNPGAGGAATAVQMEVNGALDGTGSVVLNANAANLDTALLRTVGSGAILRNGAMHTVRGTGRISGTIVNDGLVSADRSGATMDIAAAVSNNNVMQSVNGGILAVSSGTMAQGLNGVLRADAGSVALSGVSVTGGAIESVQGGVARLLPGITTVTGVRFEGTTEVHNSAVVLVRGAGMTNNGTLRVNHIAGVNDTFLQFEADSALGGTGAVVLNANPGNLNSALLRTFGAGAVIRQGSAHSVRGTGRISGVLVNDGVVRADVPSARLDLAATTTNSGSIEAVNGAILSVSGGATTQGGSGRLHAEGGTLEFSSASVVGGVVSTGKNGVARLVSGNSVFSSATAAGRVEVNGSLFLIVRGAGLTNNGTIILNSSGANSSTGLQMEVDGVLAGTGTVLLNAASAGLDSAVLRTFGAGAAIRNGAGHTIAGRGRIAGSFTNEGRLAPGNPGGGTSRIELLGPWVNRPSAELAFDIAGSGQGTTYDHLASTGAVALDGSVRVELVGGFVPARGAIFEIITAPSVSGSFQSVVLPELPLDYGFARVEYTPTGVRVRIPLCRADWNALDGGNSQDFFDFLTDFFGGTADYNRDGFSNSQDFFDFLTDFFTPCVG